MKALCFLLLLYGFGAEAQPSTIPDTALCGEYHIGGGLNVTFRIFPKNDKLMLEIVGQGQTGLDRISPLVYRPQGVRPSATIVFLQDSSGRVIGLRWAQKEQRHSWLRASGQPDGYAGSFRLDANPYRILHIVERDGRLVGHLALGLDHQLIAAGKDRFTLKVGDGNLAVSFLRDKEGRIDRLAAVGDAILVLDKLPSVVRHISNRANGFTRADSLLGMLTPLRSCYDVLFYDLDLTVLPEIKTIRGSNKIRFRVVTDFDRLQLDLHANLPIDKIVYHGQELSYRREFNAVFVRFPAVLNAGIIDSLTVSYHGQPEEPDMATLSGGIFWLWDRNHQLWIESVTQGIGANVYWPCKDHLSDRPDSMRISVTIPTGLEEISNGRLLERTDLPGGQTRFVWYVDYPIATYDVAINIGDYAHFTDKYSDSLPLDFYALKYNLAYAHWIFGDVRRMLSLYQRDFGPYPFPRDGFNILESIYPMEHQGAVSIGHMNEPIWSRQYDSAGELRTMWHESAHEWWGNSVGCSDYADLWIHESFAAYAEFLNEESLFGRDSALRELTKDHPENKEPIIGVYNVNNFHTGDMYTKGPLMLETLRDLTGNDSLWFSILQGIQRQFRYRPVKSKDIEDYFSRATGTDYSYFFDQYLRHANIPSLAVHTQQHGADLELRYKWEADVAGFRMPIKVTVGRDSLAFIYPTTSWQTMQLKGMTSADFRVDTTDFYVGIRQE